ncbi:unnamed protein product, partial [Darwinula stevensoni]
MNATVLTAVDTGHESMIHDAQMDYYGTRMATCSSDHSVKIFDVKKDSHSLVADLRGHQGPVWQVAWAHPKFGTLLASCSYDRRVLIWRERDGRWEQLHEHISHDSSVNSVSWAPLEFGLILACGSSDGSISFLSSQDYVSWSVQKIPNAHTVSASIYSVFIVGA